MCGIAGYAGLQADERLLKRMAATLAHRGPDDEGFLIRGETGLAVRRLSIIDVPGGHQPIFNEAGTMAIVFNGEIYNYRELAEDLARRGHQFRTRSDTETILHLYEEFGPECLSRLRGMFAIAIYDATTGELFLARDRLGIKPLYYSARAGMLLFASEVKAILESPLVPREPHLPSIEAFLRLRYVPGPGTMLAGVNKMPAGHWMLWRAGQLRLERYWSPIASQEPRRTDGEYEEEFGRLFKEAVEIRLISEVQLGAYLSGGLDSTAVVATMRALTGRAVKTFAVGFNWAGDELTTARAVARRLECEHEEVVCTPEDFSLLPRIIWHLDEPIGDAIVVPLFLLSRRARQEVTVVLTGEGADETLAGYLPHKAMMSARAYAALIPGFLDSLLVRPLVSHTPMSVINRVVAYPGRMGARGRTKILDYMRLLRQDRPEDEYAFLISLFDDRDLAELYADRSALARETSGGVLSSNGLEGTSYLDRILSLQYRHWLPDDILMKQDKMSMANSIEARVPFLDHRLVEFLLTVPPHLKFHGLSGKYVLRRYMAKTFQSESARRRKIPFYIPVDRYLNVGPLRELQEICLSEASVRRRGYFSWERVQALRRLAASDDFLYGKQLFALIVLELWHRIFIDRERGWVV